MRKDEEYCKAAFNNFLTIRYQSDDIVWSDGDEPPDYYLDLRGTKFAVEVTSVLEKATLGNKVINHTNVDKPIKEFIEVIQKDATEKGILKGAYIVRYKPIRDFGKQKRVISTRIMEYLQSTLKVFTAPAEEVAGEGHLRWFIWKQHSNRTYISRTTEDAKWEGEAEDELCNHLNKALETKTKNLRRFPYR